VEVTLKSLLASKMRNNLNSTDRKQIFEYEGAAGSFSSKIIIAYAFKLIGPITRADLDLIKFLRNEFAHSRMPFNFETPEVRVVCDNLKIIDQLGCPISSLYLRCVPKEELESAKDISHPKTLRHFSAAPWWWSQRT
jgi:hypothetical protein